MIQPIKMEVKDDTTKDKNNKTFDQNIITPLRPGKSWGEPDKSPLLQSSQVSKGKAEIASKVPESINGRLYKTSKGILSKSIDKSHCSRSADLRDILESLSTEQHRGDLRIGANPIPENLKLGTPDTLQSSFHRLTSETLLTPLVLSTQKLAEKTKCRQVYHPLFTACILLLRSRFNTILEKTTPTPFLLRRTQLFIIAR